MEPITILLMVTLVVGFYMAWNIGANDVANALGTSVGSGALTLKRAVLLAAVMEFSGAFIAGRNVSTTVMKGMVRPEVFAQDPMILALGMLSALLAAGVWLQIASYNHWPVSTTHSIVGAVVGFGAVYGGLQAIYWNKIAYIAMSWLVSPLLSACLAFAMFRWLSRKIFYQADPIAAAKRYLPLLVFCVGNLLAWYLMFKGLKNLQYSFSWGPALGVGAAFGALLAWIFYRLLARLQVGDKVYEDPHAPDPRAIVWLEKSMKHLRRVKQVTRDEPRFRVGSIMRDLDQITQSFKHRSEKKASSSEYQALEGIFAYLQWGSAAMMAFGHGANDVANAIGPLAAVVAILRENSVTAHMGVPTWILALGGVGIVVGLATWGWRVIDTIGRKITQLTPSRGFSAEFGAACTILFASQLGMPISTTHTLVGGVLGVGLARGIGALNMATVRDILISWMITIPSGAILAILFFFGLRSLVIH